MGCGITRAAAAAAASKEAGPGGGPAGMGNSHLISSESSAASCTAEAWAQAHQLCKSRAGGTVPECYSLAGGFRPQVSLLAHTTAQLDKQHQLRRAGGAALHSSQANRAQRRVPAPPGLLMTGPPRAAGRAWARATA